MSAGDLMATKVTSVSSYIILIFKQKSPKIKNKQLREDFVKQKKTVYDNLCDMHGLNFEEYQFQRLCVAFLWIVAHFCESYSQKAVINQKYKKKEMVETMQKIS